MISAHNKQRTVTAISTPEGASTTAEAEIPTSETNQDFVLRMIPMVSRTFALSIEALPQELKIPIATSYLLCRIADTIEDEVSISTERRRLLFLEFQALLKGERLSTDFCLAPEWIGDRADLELNRSTDRVLEVYFSLPTSQQASILPLVLELAKGMHEYCDRASQEGQLVIRSIADLDRYCYYVAGTVGKLLTNLFINHAQHLNPKTEQKIRSHAVAFGCGLQLINILRDIGTDLERGVCFIPHGLLHQLELTPQTLLDDNNQRSRVMLLKQLAEHARHNLTEAINYTLAWPTAEKDIRFFCAVPLGLALSTLNNINKDTDKGHIPRLNRVQVVTLFQKTRAITESQGSLSAFFEDLLEDTP